MLSSEEGVTAVLYLEDTAFQVEDYGDEWWGSGTGRPMAAAVVATSDGAPCVSLPVVNVEFASCAREGNDPDWWFPSGVDGFAAADKAIGICGGCTEMAACRERGRGEPRGVWGGEWVDHPYPDGAKVCAGCRAPYPLDKFRKWGTKGRMSKKCIPCLEDQPQPGVTW